MTFTIHYCMFSELIHPKLCQVVLSLVALMFSNATLKWEEIDHLETFAGAMSVTRGEWEAGFKDLKPRFQCKVHFNNMHSFNVCVKSLALTRPESPGAANFRSANGPHIWERSWG